MFLMALEKVDERSRSQRSGNVSAVNGSARGWREWIRPIAFAELVADFLWKFGQLVASINDTLGVVLSSVSVLKFGRQLTETFLEHKNWKHKFS